MSWISNFLGGFGFGSDGGSAFGAQGNNFLMSALNAGLDSLGLSQHGRDQYFNRETQREFLEAEQNFQREMFGRQTDFTREMYNLQWSDMLSKYPQLAQMLNDQQFNLWKNQFNMQNAWNAPGNQMALLKAAGINPAASGQQSSATSSMGASAAQIPPQISPVPFNANASPIGLPQGMSGRGDSIQQIGSFLKDVSEMQLNQKRIGRFDEQMDAQIKGALASAGLAESQTKYQELINSVDSFMLPHKKASEVKLNMALAAKASAEGDEAEANARLDDALIELNKTKNEEARARLPFVEMEARAEIDEIRSSAAKKRAEAKEAEQRTQTERFNTRIAEIKADTDESTKASRIAQIINDLRVKKYLSQQEYLEAKKRVSYLRGINYKRDKDVFFRYLDDCLDWLTDKVGVAINGSVSIKPNQE